MKRKTILITGGAGFIGSNFVRHLYHRYPQYTILILDALTYAGNIENLPVNINTDTDHRIQFWYGDVRNGELVDTLMAKSDMVVHFAAETHVTRSIYDNYHFFETDVLGTQVIANAVVKYRDRIERFIHISTSEVYGTARSKTMDEEHPLLPLSPYASAKAGADRLVYSYWSTYKIPAVIIRPFNAYGPYQHLEKAVSRFITSCLLDEPLRIHGTGSASRDFTFVEDLCAAIDLVLHAPGSKVHGEVFNVASGVARPIISIARDIVQLMDNHTSPINYVGDRPGQVFKHIGDTRKIRRICHWEPRVTWEEGLLKTITWYCANKSWWEKQLWMRSVPIITKQGTRELH